MDNTQRMPETVNTGDIINLTARLAQILAQEVDHLNTMNIKEVQALQEEKLFLVNALEMQRRIVAKHPHLSDTIPSQDKGRLENVVRVFEDILSENHRKLTVARAANQRIVQAITHVVKKHAVSNVYSERGIPGAMGSHPISVTLNHTA